MSEWFWKKLDLIIGYGALVLLLGLVFLEANVEIKDLDLWLHIGAGRYIVENISIPQVDIFSSTIAGTPWINHEWLFQVIAYSAYTFGGVDGIISLQVVLVCLTFLLLLFWGYRSDKQTGVICILLLVFLTYRLRFTHRPDLFSLLFFVLYIRTLSMGLKDKGIGLFVFIVQVLWTNIHGFFILGPALLGVALLSQGIKQSMRLPFQWNEIGKIDKEDFNRLKVLFVVSLLACFVNPYFVKGVWYPLKVLLNVSGDSRIFFEYIGELAKPITLGDIFVFSRYPYFKILIVVTFLSFLFNYRRIEFGALILSVIFLLVSLKAVRNGSYFAFIAYFAFLSNYQYFSPNQILSEQLIKKHAPYIFSIGFKMLLCIWMVSLYFDASIVGYYDFDKYERKSRYGGVSLRNFPAKGVDFLVDNNVKGRFFNDFNSGAYLIGRTSPNIKVFIDGRTEVYGAEFFKNYQDIWNGDFKKFKEAAKEYQLTGAFLNSIRVPAKRGIIRGLFLDREWKLVYFDYDAAIFLKDIPKNKKWIEQFEIDFEKWEAPKIDFARLGVSSTTGFRQIRRAYGLFNMGYTNLAEEEAKEVLKIEPSSAKAFNLLGKIAIERKNYDLALELLRKAKFIDVKDMEVRYNLSRSLMYLNRLDEAKEQCRKALQQELRKPKALYLLSHIYVKQKKYETAMDVLKEAYDLAPYEIEALVEIAEEFSRQGQENYSREVFEMALKKAVNARIIK